MDEVSTPQRAGHYYRRLWRSAPRELLAALAMLPLALSAVILIWAVLLLGLGLLSVLIGALLLPPALHLARFFGALERGRVHFSGRPAIASPDWDRGARPVEPPGWRLYGPVMDGHYWLYLLHALVVGPVVAMVAFVVVALWLGLGLGTVAVAFAHLLAGDPSALTAPAEWLTQFAYRTLVGTEAPVVVVVTASIVTTTMFVATLPFVTRGIAIGTFLIDRAMLGTWRSEALQIEVADLSESRGAAVRAEDVALRRLERDIHDGPQQRLIRIQMDLASAERRVDTDPAAAKVLVSEAREHVRTALEELRALSRGVAPPILQDRGLVAAVQSLAAVSPIPVSVESMLDARQVLPPEVERSVYFVIAELLANVAKHSNADTARVHLALRFFTPNEPAWLDVWVTDDGVGGITASVGHGVDGIAARVRGMRGVLVVDSPLGGPSVVGVHVPFALAWAGASATLPVEPAEVSR